MENAVKFLREAGTFFVATVEGNAPRVRPFGVALWHDGRVWFCTGGQKPCFRQMKANPAVEICAMLPDGRWLRLHGDAAFADNRAVKEKFFADTPSLADIYGGPDGPDFKVFSLENAAAALYAFGPGGIEKKSL